MRKLPILLILFPIVVFLLNGCTAPVEDGLPGDESDPSYYHSTGWRDDPQHGGDYSTNPQNCKACHGDDLEGGSSGISCVDCHHSGSPETLDACQACHGDYTDSAHGNPLYGVDRSGTGYAIGACTHCHDPNGPNYELMLFAPMEQTSQTDNFCFQCHQATGDSVQIVMPLQRSYSYRAGDWTDDPLDDVKEAFSNTSSHNLGNILTFITGKWGYTSDSNPCAACHNPHAAQRDSHTAGDRGWPVTLPSKHGSSVAAEQLWGDDAGEKMSDYTDPNLYQAPYRFGGVGNGYEPDDSGTTDGSNLTSYATFCQDCHTNETDMSSFGLTHTPFDWTTTGDESDLPDSAGGDKHGINPATNSVAADLKEPYATAWDTNNEFVLSCTDCHEPHGSPSDMLIRGEVNGAAVGAVSIGSPKDLQPLCDRCHQQSLWMIHHTTGGLADAAYDTAVCIIPDCHNANTGNFSIPCSNCHFHGGDDSWLTDPASGVINGANYVTGRRTF